MTSSDRFVQEFIPEAFGALSGRDPKVIKNSKHNYWLTATFSPFGPAKNGYSPNLESLARAYTENPKFFPAGTQMGLYTPNNLLLTSLPYGYTAETISNELFVMTASAIEVRD